uniref:C4H2-type domain-containing protein n=1 Tax=Globodera rostochiensis TaxID=31243 RepID=A0A914HF83_GLORO
MEEDDHPTPSSSSTVSSTNAAPYGSTSLVQIKQESVDAHQSQADTTADSSGVVHALFTMAEARSAVAELGRCWTELREDCGRGKRVTELETACDQVARWLEEEKKVHQEELKQINQDINLLEDFLRDRKPRLARKKAETERKMEQLLRKVLSFDVEQSEVKSGPDQQQNQSESSPYDRCQPTPNQFNGQFFLWAFQWFMLFHQQRLQLQQQLLQNNNTNTSSHLLNQQRGLNMNNNNIVPMPTTMARQQQQAKMKVCTSCQELIHRNAPTCPFCKKKITSKAAKRVRK